MEIVLSLQTSPLGAGVKYKVAPESEYCFGMGGIFHLVINWMEVEDPYGIKSTGIFKNKDCYSMLQLMLTYDIMSKCKLVIKMMTEKLDMKHIPSILPSLWMVMDAGRKGKPVALDIRQV